MMSAPITVCRFITVNSSSVSGPGLLRIASGIPILPTSCSSAPIRTALQIAAREAELLADEDGELGDRVGVAAGVGVLRLERRRQGCHGGQVLLLERARPAARLPARCRPGRPGAGRTARSSAVKTRRRVSNSSIRPAGGVVHDQRHQQAGLEARSRSRKRVLGRIAAVADRGRRLDQLGQHPPGRRVVVERVVLGHDVELRRRDHVRGPVGHRLRRRVEGRDEARRCVEEQRQLAREHRHRLAAISGGPRERRVASITAIRSRKTAVSRNSPGRMGTRDIGARRPKLDD